MQITSAKSTLRKRQKSKIALVSQRQRRKHVSYCFIYEFEDLIADVESIDIFSSINSSQKLNQIYLEQDYQLFFSVFAQPWEICSLNRLQNNWRDKCQKAVCYLIEVWQSYLEGNEHLLEPLKQFDHIFLGVRNEVENVAKITGRPCSYLPPSIDSLKFCPYPTLSHRSIYVLSMGRRSPITHQALMDLAQQEQIFYYYDTIRNLEARNNREHRTLISNLAKRSRYFIAHRANINEDFKTKGKEEVGYRFFEGAAAGTVMLGEHPTHEEFYKHFDWQDAVIKIPFDAPDIGDLIAELDEQPERLARIRKDNVVNSLLRHDFVYRWQEILAKVGLKPTPKMLSRETALSKLAWSIENSNCRC